MGSFESNVALRHSFFGPGWLQGGRTIEGYKPYYVVVVAIVSCGGIIGSY